MNIEDGLRAKVRELEEELAEWRTGARQLKEAELEAQHLARAMRVFNIGKSKAAILICLASAPDRVRSYAFLSALTGLHEMGSLRTTVSDLRRMANTEITSVYGVGWLMRPGAASKIRAELEMS